MRRKNRGFTVGELLICVVILGVLVAIFLPALERASEVGKPASCANNLKQLGLSLKIYANENDGEKYPPMQVEVTLPGLVNSDHPDPSKWDSFNYDFVPRIRSIYPEYMSDIKVLICPQDLNHRLRDRESDELSCAIYDNSWDKGSADLNIADGCMDELGDSYVYFSWVFDKLDSSDPITTGFPKSLEQSFWSIDQHIPFDAYKTAPKDPFPFPTQLAATFTAAQNRAWPILEDAFTNTENGHQELLKVWDDDQNLSEEQDFFLGNGNSNTMFRLREGIERFLITDINNAKSGAQAQSDVPIVMDHPSVKPKNYTHEPAGANVMFMDGHVEFIRNNDGAPVTSGVAHIIQPIRNHDFGDQP
jgi:prepilin-type N-terminal cleavage/methylation domain-containing protein/prepilin-type processing-associated H-X9-DG protein